MRRGNVRAGVVVTLVVAAVSSCGTPTPPHKASPSASATVASRPSAAAGPCASVTTTTAIAQVPAACAAVWAPYGVTKVPPANLLDATPVPPPVVNGTQGAVSDAAAQAWATAANQAAVWYRWAEKYGQLSLLRRLLTSSLIPGVELAALSKGAQINEPNCSSFGTRYAFFPIGTGGAAFFASLGQHTTALFVLAETYPGPCQIAATYPDGRNEVLFSYSTAGTTVFAGSVHHDLLLGDFWHSEAAADCASQHGPPMWCST